MSPITTHILDTSLGKPAAGVEIILYCNDGDTWKEMARGVTNSDGRISDLLKEGSVEYGAYKMRFETKDYFDKMKIATFYPYVEIIFDVSTQEHYHVPLLLNPFGYSTYRGS
jgi:5-hydroxyisourate hydrolase